MKYIYIIAVTLIITACGKIKPKGEIINTFTPTENFNQINLKGKYRAFLVHSNENLINIETYKNIGENINIDNKNGILNITEKNKTEPIDFYNITIYTKNIPTKINLEDSIELNIVGKIKQNQITIDMKNNTKFIGNIDYQNTILNMNNTARANFNGKTKNMTINSKDTANIISPFLTVNTLNINTQNGTYTEIQITDTINAKMKNTAKIIYYGKPIKNIQKNKLNKKQKSNNN